jgi:hypothetical protein
MEDDAHAKYVQLHIQIVNYHTKIQHMMNSLDSGVKSRIGFVPRDILTLINKVRNLPVPLPPPLLSCLQSHRMALQVPGADILYTRKSPKKPIDKGPILRSRSFEESPSSPHTTPAAADQDPNLTPSLERMTQHGLGSSPFPFLLLISSSPSTLS